MAMSGVGVDDQCVNMWQLLKERKIKSCNFRFSKDGKKIVVEEGSVQQRKPRDPANPQWFENWTQMLPEDQCRYSIYDVEIGINLGSGMSTGSRNKLVFCVWAPSSAKIKDRMLTASSKDALKKKFDGIQMEWQLNGPEDYEGNAIIDNLKNLPDIKTSGTLSMFEGLPISDW